MKNLTFDTTPLQGLLIFVCFTALCGVVLMFFLYPSNKSVVHTLAVKTDLQQVIIETKTKEGLKANITLGLKNRCSWLFDIAGNKITMKIVNKKRGEVYLISPQKDVCGAYVVNTD